MDAAAREAHRDVRTARRYPYVPPRDPTPEECAERDQCIICQTTTLSVTCTFRGHVPLEPPEFVCPPQPCGHEVPGPVLDLGHYARDLDWLWLAQHSRGRVLSSTGRQLVVAELWSVRFRRGEWGGYAVRRAASWESVCVTGAALPPFTALGVTDLREWLAEPERDPSWYQEIRDRVAAQKFRQKQAAKARQAAGTKRIDHAL